MRVAHNTIYISASVTATNNNNKQQQSKHTLSTDTLLLLLWCCCFLPFLRSPEFCLNSNWKRSMNYTRVDRSYTFIRSSLFHLRGHTAILDDDDDVYALLFQFWTNGESEREENKYVLRITFRWRVIISDCMMLFTFISFFFKWKIRFSFEFLCLSEWAFCVVIVGGPNQND